MNRRRSATLLLCSLVVLALVGTVAPGCSLVSQKTEVLFIGDSIMNGTKPFLTGQLSAQPDIGPVDTRVDARNGTGLLTPALYDWVGKAPGMASTYRPKIVVVQFVGNYTGGTDPPFWKDAQGNDVPAYTDAWFAEWGQQARKLTSAFEAKGAKVFWVLPIPLAGEDGKQREAKLRATYEAIQQDHPNVGFIDGRKALGGDQGQWVWSRPGIDGTDVTVRVADGLHLTEDGGRLLAREISTTIAPALVAARGAKR